MSTQEESWIPRWMKHLCVQGHLGQILIFKSIPGSVRNPAGEWTLMVLVFSPLLLCGSTISSHLAFLFPCLASPLFHTSRLSRLLSKLKGTSKWLGNPDMLWWHQTLWSVWGSFCQGQSALEVWNSCITGSFSSHPLWAGVPVRRITSGSMYHL